MMADDSTLTPMQLVKIATERLSGFAEALADEIGDAGPAPVFVGALRGLCEDWLGVMAPFNLAAQALRDAPPVPTGLLDPRGGELRTAQARATDQLEAALKDVERMCRGVMPLLMEHLVPGYLKLVDVVDEITVERASTAVVAQNEQLQEQLKDLRSDLEACEKENAALRAEKGELGDGTPQSRFFEGV